MKSTSESISEQFMNIMNKILVLDKSNTLTIDEGLKLYPSEIHLILALGTGQAKDFGDLVRHLGITKGAVSQTITRLEKKGILSKKKDHKANGLSISFTSLGKRTFDSCIRMRKALVQKISLFFSSNPENDNEAIRKFLDHLDTSLNEYGKS